MSHIFRIIREDDNGYRTCQSHYHTAELANLARSVFEQMVGSHKQTIFVLPLNKGEVCPLCNGQKDHP